ncbi:UNVERIFIED_CONTAM: Polygalacturonase [Sesamum radiatum]|uniref:Polygalacturonase n=1 Tax=Sesamum radiatum TaxID=300843 RepID=A0AAW2VMX5_SESRA
MAVAINFTTILFFLPLLAINVYAQGPVTYDITKYGAKPGADISQATIRPLSSFKSKEHCKPILIPVNCRINKGNGLLNYVNFHPFDGQGQQAWKQNDCHKNRNCAKLPMNLSFNFINNSIIQDVTTKDSKNFHVNCISSHNVTFADSQFQPREIAQTLMGEDMAPAPATLTVSDLHFEDLIMDNVSSPIIIDQEYCPHNLCKKDRPSSIKITNVSIKNVRGTTNSAEAVTFICSGLKPCENVEVGDIDLTYTGNQSPITTKCANVKPKFVGKQNPPVCAATAQSA